MKSISVLPTFVSQDADLKAKESSLFNESVNDGEGFSSLVDKHLSEGRDSQSAKGNMNSRQSEAAKAEKEIAANGKEHQDTSSTRQESDSQIHSSVNGQDKNADKTIEKQTSKADDEEQLDNNENEALTESAQFISLLYNSDQTLNDSNQHAKQQSQTSSVTSTNTQHLSDAEDGSGEGAKKGAESNVELANKQVAEHKLKAFSNDELLKHAQLKGHNALSAELSGQALKDYQAALQSKQAGVSSDSITSDQLLKSQLAEKDLNNKISDIAASVSKASNGLFKEKQDPGLYQLPVEPIVKGEVKGEGKGDIKATADSAAALKAAQVTGELKPIADKATLTVETKTDSDAKLAAELTSVAKGANIAAEQLNAKAEKGEGKIELSSSLANSGQGTKANHEKVVAERSSANVTVNENISKEFPKEQLVKQPSINSAQAQVIQQSQNQQKEQLGTNEQQAFDEAVDEYAYTDSSLLAQTKNKLQPEQSGFKTADSFNLRSAAEMHAQALQANQLKQSNDAYAEHQVAEVLNHNVATDIAQIQKNNVQLQQETISIFRKDFAEAVKDKVMVSINQKLQQFDITLDPPEFGNMQVRVNLQGEQAAVNFVVQNQQAKEALEQNMHKLKDMLAEQGVDVGGANVEQQSQQHNSDEEATRGTNGDSSSGNKSEEGNVDHVLSANLFDSSATGVDYYA